LQPWTIPFDKTFASTFNARHVPNAVF
jgi:hypothetical protein